MDWDSEDEDQLLIIDADLVEPVDNLVMSITEVEITEEMSRTVMLLAHKYGSAPDAVDYTLQLSSHAVYQLFASMSINLPELVKMGWIPSKEPGGNGG